MKKVGIRTPDLFTLYLLFIGFVPILVFAMFFLKFIWRAILQVFVRAS